MRTCVLTLDWGDCMPIVDTVEELLSIATALGARKVSGWSRPEEKLVQALPAVSVDVVLAVRNAIAEGKDPLGDLYCELLSPDVRRPMGAVYTPLPIVRAMIDLASTQLEPTRVVDPGIGSGRFLVATGHQFQRAQLIGIDCDPVAAILARGHVAAAGYADRTRIVVEDYRKSTIEQIPGVTLFIGNPPYVRHHGIGAEWKQWLTETARRYSIAASQLAGLHAYFFLATAEYAQPGDIGIFITSAEWLDVNYGRLIRELLVQQLGLDSLQLIEPTLAPFPGTATTAVITSFQVGRQPSTISVRRVATLDELNLAMPGEPVQRTALSAHARWTILSRPTVERRADFVELGEYCRVHRGQATGANKVWIVNGESGLPPGVLFSTVTRARELLEAGLELSDCARLKHVIDIPPNLEEFAPEERSVIERFLLQARALGADQGYIAQHRRPWWAVNLREPAPILATYMARRPPVFVRNLAKARHINVAHGLYPHEPMSDGVLMALARFLSQSTTVDQGRTYAGGLTKFEPGEMERILVPRLELLEHYVGDGELLR